jgi:hypothetical protein
MKIWIFLIFLFAAASTANADDLRSKYVGKDSCGPDLHGTHRYGMRLDKTKNAYLSARTLGGEKVLMIIQYVKDGDSCGVVRDVIAMRNAKASFEFVCVECSDPSGVVIGTWPDDDKSTSASAIAIESWQINLGELTFSPISKQVRCFRETYHGVDEGEDLVSWARNNIGQKCTKAKASTAKLRH